ncbi:hypothetical protein DRE_01855 [Drechslerella stenobrocha 248]|uniref:Methyltransferase-like protein 4 n=1 Tax=Drechslerella stenobrocha 248 TaxID=1043628 RepID=W7I8K1_9PEZI|nr:hypothetical protein DRE_01855 [Drechslerella stenobrocha 248]
MPTDDHDDVLLIDIAASLSSPPFLPRKPAAAPVTAPFVVSEPRSGVPFDQGLVDRYEARKQWIHSRLALLQSTFKARFPLKPSFPDEDLKSRPSDDDGAPDLLAYQANLGAAWTINSLRDTEISVDLTAAALQELSLVDIYGIVHYNPLPFWLTLKLNISKPYEYMIPPRSSFLLGPFTSTIPVFTAFAGATAPPGLDFILLDPPWPNRSAHRARHQHAYKTSTFDAYDLFKLGVPRLLRQDAAGLVGIWVTNSSKWRAFVLDKLFAAWKLRPVAEWLWVKITVDGEPIFNLDNIARKPYESLILGR